MFAARHDILVAPSELSRSYNMILGAPFLDRFHAVVGWGRNERIALTASDNSETVIARDPGFEEEEARVIEEREEARQAVAALATMVNPAEARECLRGPTPAERQATAAHRRLRVALASAATPRPPTGHERRAARREEEEDEKPILDEGERELREAEARRPDLFMPFENFQALMASPDGALVAVSALLWRRHTPETELRAAAAAVSGSQGDEGGTGELEGKEKQRAEVATKAIVTEFKPQFPDKLPPGIPPMRGSEGVEIHTFEGAQPAGQYSQRMSYDDSQLSDEMIDELLKMALIQPSRSPWGAPMFLVAKPDGGKRMVIDYRALNSKTIRNRHPLPRVDELFDQLQGAQYFSKIDLRTGYWQIRMHKDSVAKTAFTSRRGHFEWLVLPMGLTNAPAEFMALMENTFRAELNKSILVFLDDILVFSKTFEEHVEHLRAAMGRLRDAKLYAKLSKCSFFRQEVEFLGHYVGRAGVRMVDGKVEAVARWPEPKKQREVEQFIGMAGYYRRFIKDFSRIAKPLTALCGTRKTKKTGSAPPKKPFVFGTEERQAFLDLKRAVMSAPCLAMADPSKEFIVHTDASGFATGAALMQHYEDGLRPVAFMSKRMRAAELNYPIYEQELLAILNALRTWRHYLSGRRFTVLTDHQSLQYIQSSKMATPRQVRWAAMLSEFDFVIKYSPGEKNQVADGLSRRADLRDRSTDGGTSVDVEGVEEPMRLLNAIRAMAPLPVRIRQAAEDDPEYRREAARTAVQLTARKLVKVDGLLYRKTEDGEAQLLVPENAALRTWLLAYAHDATDSGHRGAERMTGWLRQRVWWTNIHADVAKYVRGCEECQKCKPDPRGRQGRPRSNPTPRRAGEWICIDFIGPLPRSGGGYDAIMVVVDKLTRYVIYVPFKIASSAQEVFRELSARWIAVFGAPQFIISDRDVRFTSRFWEDMFRMMSTTLKRSTAFHPQTDGTTERANRVLIEAMRTFVDEQRTDWDVLLPCLQRATNSSVCASTGFTPDFMMFGREMYAALDADLEESGVLPRAAYPGALQLHERRAAAEASARQNILKAQAKQRADAESGRREPEIKQGDQAWLSNKNMRSGGPDGIRKLEPLYLGPYDVVRMHGPNAAELKLPATCRLHPVFNLDLLKKYVDGHAEFPDRPARHERPGPVPEEDEAAGGPASVEPLYEVDAVIAARGRLGSRSREYRVLWKGWPREQASWLRASECDSCREKVDEFEAAELLRAVNAVGRRRQRLAKGGASAAVKASVSAAESQRVKVFRANELVGAPNRCDAAGEVKTSTQQCLADTKGGNMCKQRTSHGCFCWVHRLSRNGTRIKKSNIPFPCGDGLFAARRFEEDEVVAYYTGDLMDAAFGRDEDGFGGSAYVLELSKDVALDASRRNADDGRMLNDPSDSTPGRKCGWCRQPGHFSTRCADKAAGAAQVKAREANVRFSVNHQTKTVKLIAKRVIQPGEELYVSYGASFWEQVADIEAGRARRPVVLSAVDWERVGAPVAEEDRCYHLFPVSRPTTDHRAPMAGATAKVGAARQALINQRLGLELAHERAKASRRRREEEAQRRRAVRQEAARRELGADDAGWEDAPEFRVAMLGRGAPSGYGRWVSGLMWQCFCPSSVENDDDRHGAAVRECDACGAQRPPEERRQRWRAEQLQEIEAARRDLERCRQRELQAEEMARQRAQSEQRQRAQAQLEQQRRQLQMLQSGSFGASRWLQYLSPDGREAETARLAAHVVAVESLGAQSDRLEAEARQAEERAEQQRRAAEEAGRAAEEARRRAREAREARRDEEDDQKEHEEKDAGEMVQVRKWDRSRAAPNSVVDPATLIDSAPVCGDCRGTATKDPRLRHLVRPRLQRRTSNSCRREWCECCAPAGMNQWCSCTAMADGLCRRCWLDYFGGKCDRYPSGAPAFAEYGKFYYPPQTR